MNIAIAHPYFISRGGAERKVLLIANHLKKIGYSVKIFTHVYFPKKSFPEYTKNIDFLVVPYSRSIFGRFFSVIKLARQLKSYDVVHSNNIPSYFEAGIAKLLYKNKTIWFCNDYPMHYTKQKKTVGLVVKRLLEKIILKRIDVIVTNSKFTQKAVKKHLGRDSQIIYSGVDTELFKQSKKKKSDSVIELFTSGRLEEYKNFSYLIKLVSELSKDYNVRLRVAGDGPLKSKLKRQAGKLLNKKIFFLGNTSQQQIIKLYQQSDIFLFSSINEPLGVTLLEAMATQLPVVAFNCGGPKETIKHGVTGYLAKNEIEYENYVRKLLDSSSLRKKMGLAGRKRVIEFFSVEQMISKTQQLYEKVVRKA
ncbi:glycosyltransferase family 4 protein [Candidatus Woesearchaeota archaeon]|nr:glycosyltransferase family 4 protein [Candidatus Woesearchaeota archaeon]